LEKESANAPAAAIAKEEGCGRRKKASRKRRGEIEGGKLTLQSGVDLDLGDRDLRKLSFFRRSGRREQQSFVTRTDSETSSKPFRRISRNRREKGEGTSITVLKGEERRKDALVPKR